MQILNALDLKNGKKSKNKGNALGVFSQPLQFLPRSEKDFDWYALNMDFYEWLGMKQITAKAPRLMKNYKLAKGIIDKSDYIVDEGNEYSDVMHTLLAEDNTAFELKFYPIIPTVIDTLCTEFAKRTSKVDYTCNDEYSQNELLSQKQNQIEKTLLAEAEKKMMQSLLDQGLDPEDPQVQEQMQQQLSPENLKTLPDIENFFRKDYVGLVEQWAETQHNVDVDRFRMDELEERNFRNMLTTDSEFWHFRMMDDDYDVEIWNPVLTFYSKSTDVRFISQGAWVGKSEMLTVSDAIDKYGAIMNEEQMLSLEQVYPAMSAGYTLTGMPNDGSFYDNTKSHEWNTNMPSLAYRQYTSAYANGAFGGDIVKWIMGESEDNHTEQDFSYLLRATTVYWKTQRRVGHLTKIKESGEVIVTIVDEDYDVTDKPLYNTTLIKNKNAETLIFGEHIEWIWINQVCGGLKIGPNMPSYWGMQNIAGISPIYLGIDQNQMGPLRFQFRGDKTLYGCKLPVEGAVFSDYNTRSVSMVDLMKPFQITYNLVNNQLSDILVDELGTVVMLDQNALPKHSLGEDWGKGNYVKAYGAMKQFQVLPLDTSISNTENATNFSHFQKLDLSQTERLMSRISIANYSKQQALEVIGITPQRLGQENGRQTATGVEQNLNASYAQTEKYFTQHCDYLMPRVHQMRTDLAQFYQSRKPSVRLQCITSTDEKANFAINGTDLLLADINVYSATKVSVRTVVEQLKQYALSNNTISQSLVDVGRILKESALSSLENTLLSIEDKNNKIRQEQGQNEQKIEQMRIEAAAQEKQLVLESEAREAEKDRRKDILVAEIRAAGYMGMADQDKNQQSDFIDYMNNLTKSDEFQQGMGLEQEKESNKKLLNNDKQALKREEMANKLQMKQMDVNVASINRNRFDAKPKPKPKKK